MWVRATQTANSHTEIKRSGRQNLIWMPPTPCVRGKCFVAFATRQRISDTTIGIRQSYFIFRQFATSSFVFNPPYDSCEKIMCKLLASIFQYILESLGLVQAAAMLYPQLWVVVIHFFFYFLFYCWFLFERHPWLFRLFSVYEISCLSSEQIKIFFFCM